MVFVIVINAVLAGFVLVGIVGLQAWAIWSSRNPPTPAHRGADAAGQVSWGWGSAAVAPSPGG